jgi:methionyl-tRNA formyltransferase
VRVVFLGSGRFALSSLEALVEAGHELLAVVTQPDKEQGRGRTLAATPVKRAALARGLAVLQPRRAREADAVSALRRLQADLHVVVAYGQILPKAVLEIPPRGTVNVHASLLPAYRGAAPIQWAIANGESETGVTTMLLDEGLDTGPTLLSRREAIAPDDTAATLEPRLARIGADLLIETLLGLTRGAITPTPQDPARATYAPLLTKQDGRVRWTETAAAIERKVRAFRPWPGASTSLAGRVLKILQARVVDGAAGEPGAVLAVDALGLLVACGGPAALRLVLVQPESRRAMPASAYAAGARIQPGQRFG